MAISRSNDSAPAAARGRLVGAHMPTSGGIQNALIDGKRIGCTAVQLFTCSPRQWSHPALKQQDIELFLEARQETGIEFTAAHDSYLINLAAPSEEILRKSQAAFEAELTRADALNISWLVTHMGAHLGQGEDEAMARLVESLRTILKRTDDKGYRVGIALETTAGQGTGLGWRFEQLGSILEGVGEHPRLGVCLDTCHVFVAGYDLRGAAEYESTWDEFDKRIGRPALKLIHANDAKKPLGSRVDRHEHIGRGELGMAAFARLVTDSRIRDVPVIIETPDADTMHAVNVSILKRLSEGQPPAIQVEVQLFGHLRDVGEALHFELPIGSTVRSLVEALAAHDARLGSVSQSCRFAVDDAYCELDRELENGATVAVLPPVSGG